MTTFLILPSHNVTQHPSERVPPFSCAVTLQGPGAKFFAWGRRGTETALQVPAAPIPRGSAGSQSGQSGSTSAANFKVCSEQIRPSGQGKNGSFVSTNSTMTLCLPVPHSRKKYTPSIEVSAGSGGGTTEVMQGSLAQKGCIETGPQPQSSSCGPQPRIKRKATKTVSRLSLIIAAGLSIRPTSRRSRFTGLFISSPF